MKTIKRLVAIGLGFQALLVCAAASADWTVGLQELDLSSMSQGWGTPQIDKSVGGQPLTIGGRQFVHGVGTHAVEEYALDLHGTATRFSAWVGVDDDAQAPGSVTFQVVGDGKTLWQSGVMRWGEPAKEVSVDLVDVKKLVLLVGDAGDGNGMDHADWAEAKISGRSNKPVPFPPDYRQTLDLTHPLEVAPVGKNSWGGTNPRGDRVTVTSQSLEWNGKPFIVVAGEMHPTRTDENAWEESILKMKAGGLNTVSCYLLWNHFEQDPCKFDFTGNRNIRRFVQLCQKHGMFVWLRIGPFCNSEALAGGLPQWLFGEPVHERSNDTNYLFYVERLYRQYSEQLHGMMFRDGGPVIAIQVENEYQVATPYWDYPYPGAGGGNTGSDGAAHMLKLKQLAQVAGLDAPLWTCTGWQGAPVPTGELLATYGCYAYLGAGGPTITSAFVEHLKQPGYPLAFCELGGGTPAQASWRPIVPPESVEVGLFTRVATGGNLTGIYMYHGGMHPLGSHGPLNVATWLPILSYDFSAPIGEFGDLRQSYYQCRPFQQFLDEFPELLAPMQTVWPEHDVQPTDTRSLRYIARVNGDSGFLFLNNYQDKLTLPDRTNVQVRLQLKDETLSIPDLDAGLTLKSGVMAALPFNLALGGAKLKYATAQLMTRVTVAGKTTYVFLAPNGMKAEYVFAGDVNVSGGCAAIAREATCTRASIAEPGLGAVFDMTAADGKVFSVLTLTRHQAERCLKVKDLWGGERLVLSEDDVICDGQTLRVSAVGRNDMSVAVFPNPSRPPTGPGGKLHGTADGIFTRYQVTLPLVKPQAEIQRVADDKLLVRVPPAEFKKFNDLFLKLEYAGDRGWAFIDGSLVADNFNYGTPWQVGLKRWNNEIGGDGLFVRIVPWKGDTSKVLFDGITFKPVESVQGAAVGFKSVKLVPEYAAEIR